MRNFLLEIPFIFAEAIIQDKFKKIVKEQMRLHYQWPYTQPVLHICTYIPQYRTERTNE